MSRHRFILGSPRKDARQKEQDKVAQVARLKIGTDGNLYVESGKYRSKQHVSNADIDTMFVPFEDKKAFQVWVDDDGHLRIGKWKGPTPLSIKDAFALQEFAGEKTQATKGAKKDSYDAASAKVDAELDEIINKAGEQ